MQSDKLDILIDEHSGAQDNYNEQQEQNLLDEVVLEVAGKEFVDEIELSSASGAELGVSFGDMMRRDAPALSRATQLAALVR